MPEAQLQRAAIENLHRGTGIAISVGEIWQLPNGRAAYNVNTAAVSSGDYGTFWDEGKIAIPLTSGVTILDGLDVYWDHSASAGHYKKVNDRDFRLGTAYGDAANGVAVVDVNKRVEWNWDIKRDSYARALTGTQALGGFGVLRNGGTHNIVLSSTNEAQIASLLLKDGFAVTANAIIEIIFNVVSDGAGTVVDVNLGIGNGTHATDFDSVTEAFGVHLDANNTNINIFSRDAVSTPVASTDSTIDYTEGSGMANRVVVWLDMRTPADCQVYINGANVLPSSVFDMDGATGPLRLIAHVEKTASTDTYELDIEELRGVSAEQ